MTNSVDKAFRICALCKHFRVHESKREFPILADTAYITYGCEKLGWTSREDYLMESAPMASYAPDPKGDFDCPHWEAPGT